MTSPDPIDHTHEFVHEQEMLRTTMVAGLMAQASELSTAAHDLIRSAVLTRVQRWVIFAGLLLTLLSAVLSAAGMWSLRSIASSNKATNANTNQVTKAILDCTDPTGECFQQGQARTAEAVGNINRVVVLAAACARVPDNDTQEEIEDCVKQGLLK